MVFFFVLLYSRWSTDLANVHVTVPPFTGSTPGSRLQSRDTDTEVNFFATFFRNDTMEAVRDETNRYAQSRIATQADPKWVPVTLMDIRVYIGIRIYMSVLILPSYDMYWSKDFMFGQLYIPKVMTRDRFERIQKYFHAADHSNNPQRGAPGHDKLAHIRPVLESVRSRCKQLYNPHQNSSVDEAMIAFRGRLGFKQYIPAKPTKYGIKVWCRADPVNGYLNDFQVYVGKVGNRAEVGLGARVVHDLTQDIAGRNHIINMDNYFSSPELYVKMLEDNLRARGTVRPNRKGFPANLLKDKDLKQQGDMIAAQKDELSAIKWKDKRIVSFLSTAEDGLQVVEVDRKQKDGSVKKVAAPKVVSEYNANMNGVDHADQIRSCYSTYRASRKWWHYIFWFLVDVSIANAFILFKESPAHQKKSRKGNPLKPTILKFRMNLAKELIGTHRAQRKRTAPQISDPMAPEDVHMPIEGKKLTCKHCSRPGKGNRHESRVQCKACKVNLCVKCFIPYHAKK